MKLTNAQWEAVAAALQYRIFAIYALSQEIEPDLRDLEKGITLPADKIADLCQLPYQELVKKGLLYDNHHSRE